MNRAIWKFPILTTDRQTVSMPDESEILCIQVQGDVPCLWALVYPRAQKSDRTIEVFGTGHPISYDIGTERKYVGTYQLHGGSLVFHVFERIA